VTPSVHRARDIARRRLRNINFEAELRKLGQKLKGHKSIWFMLGKIHFPSNAQSLLKGYSQMPSLEDNLSAWNTVYNWKAEGDEWSSCWGGPEAQWFGTLYPRIHRFIPRSTILEIAPGHGRWTHFLKNYCENLIVVDLAEKCIEACKERFKSSSHVTCYVNDGKSLEMVPDNSIDFVFSFDSLVHVEKDVIEGYLGELSRKLRPNGIGFIHHSNLAVYVDGGEGHLDINSTCWRGKTMSARLFEEYSDKFNLQCISQELTNWNNDLLIDTMSVFTPKGSVWARPNRVVENGRFRHEISMIGALSHLYT
jgi:ubiquinone/menaquinone biosynthesis C-methylase UbiE